MDPKRPTRWELLLIVLMILCFAAYVASLAWVIVRDARATFGG